MEAVRLWGKSQEMGNVLTDTHLRLKNSRKGKTKVETVQTTLQIPHSDEQNE